MASLTTSVRAQPRGCPVHGIRVVNVVGPPFEGAPAFYRIARRIARRFGPRVAQLFTRAFARIQNQIDTTALRGILDGADLTDPATLANIQATVLVSRLGAIISGDLQSVLLETMTATGSAGADVLSEATGLRFRFNDRDVNTVLFARTQTANLVVQVTDATKEAIRIITAAGADLGLTVDQQARAIREFVGLPPNWVRAPLNMERELRAGSTSVLRRRWSAVDKAKIRSRIKKGTVDDAFVSQMRKRYTESLINRRSLNIARTETLRASHAGQREAWRQAVTEKVLPQTARRFWIVTPDDRLRDTHAAVPEMNPEGVGLDDAFETPLGPSLGPPLEVNCRCGEGLQFPGQPGVL